MPRRYPAELRQQVIELARSGTKVAQLATTFGMSDATIYSWLKQDKVDRGEIPKAIQTFMGHSKIQTTFDIYGHLLPGSHDEVREQTDAYLANPSQRPT